MMEYKKYFDILGLPYTASGKEVKDVYRDLSRRLHAGAVESDGEFKARADARIEEIDIAYSAIQEAFKQGRLGNPEQRAAELGRFDMTEALREAQSKALGQVNVAGESKQIVESAEITPKQEGAGDQLEEIRQAQRKAFEKAAKPADETGMPEAASSLQGVSYDRIQRDKSGFPVIESQVSKPVVESEGVAGELKEAIKAVSFMDLSHLPRGWAGQWVFAFICFGIWLLVSAVCPVAKLMSLQIGYMDNPDEWTVAEKDPGLHKRWQEYQRQKREFLSKYYGRPVGAVEAQSWLPPYYLEASAGTAGIDPQARTPENLSGGGFTSEINQVAPRDDAAGSQYAPRLPRHNIPTH